LIISLIIDILLAATAEEEVVINLIKIKAFLMNKIMKVQKDIILRIVMIIYKVGFIGLLIKQHQKMMKMKVLFCFYLQLKNEINK
jgi:hypothetical protein